MQGSKKLASLPNKISNFEPGYKEASFRRSLTFSIIFHVVVLGAVFGATKFNVPLFKRKPPPIANVVWTQSVKRPKPTIPDKLPPPMVPVKKEEVAKKDEVNVKKTPEVKPKKEPELSTKDKMKKALEALKSKVKDDDDRPAPKEDNFPTAEKKPEGVLGDTEILALQASSIYSAYIQQIKEQVKSNFTWYKTGSKFSATVSMKIDPKGNVTAKIQKSSGDFSYDQATLRAIQRSNPLPAPPTELIPMFMQEDVDVEFERKEQ
jgi:TonB family protein